MTANTPEHDEAIDRAAKIMAESLARGLMEAEVILGAEREARAQTVPQLLDTLERFGEALTRLAEFTERLGERMNELTDAVATLANTREARPAASPTPQLPAMEPSFASGGEGIDVTIAAVPGFQGLMDLQRALVRLPQVQSAAVRRYQDDEAAIQLVLSQPMTASAIVEGVADATGRQIVVDEARPDALRLRLRFLAE
jgi:hypothetical protein